jgi:RimJ/RimL family protein N-acetyltransferase
LSEQHHSYNFDIVHIKQLGGTRFMGYALIAQAAMIKAGQSSNLHASVHWENEGVFAVLRYPEELQIDDPEIIGMITFSDEKWRSQFYIGLGFVTPRFRSDHVYKVLWNRLVEIAQDRGVPAISGTTYANNHVMRETAKKLGRKEVGIVLEFDVPERRLNPVQ